MRLATQLLLIGSLLCSAGCQSVESQKRRFVNIHNSEIGRPFYAYEKRGRKELKISDSVSEFMPETIPNDRAAVAWTVDTTTRGPYQHPDGITFQIEGIKTSWRLLGDPELARVKINWWGPW
ncbi:MAG TPA: hypothetical protein VEB66_11400 [Opitutaceae bacterium]|nr:hypothetical protein [Opitutaceae bacterium]